jgi:TolB-like protein/DNA-binding SARP family transcriptional activator
MHRFTLSLLGRFELLGSNGPVGLNGKKLSCLLGFLAATPAAHRREKLMTLLWSSHPDAQARQSLRQALHQLRSALGADAISASGDMVALRAGILACDVQIFERLVQRGGREALREATTLYKGRLLSDFPMSEEPWNDWADVEAQRLETTALDAMLKLGELELAALRPPEALALAHRALEISNLREDLHRLMMRALIADGRRAEAIKHCERLRSILKADLGAEPDAATLVLEAELRRSTTAPPTLHSDVLNGLSPLPVPDLPSIAVLPFANMSSDPTQDYFADGIVEDVITELSRFDELFVIARNSTFQFKNRAIDIREIGRELGVRYILEGSIRRGDDLIDAETGRHLWAEKFDYALGDMFELQDAITQSVVAAIQPQILVSEGRRAARKSPANLDAFDCCMRGIWHNHQGGPENNRHAEHWLRRSINIDPNLACAYVTLSRVLYSRCWAGFSEDIDCDLEASQAAVDRALALNSRDPAGQYALSILSLMMRRHDRALAAAEQAVGLNRNFSLGHFALGENHVFLGNFTEALDPLTRCLRLSPLDPHAATFINLIALANYHLGNYEEAAAWAERALQRRRMPVILQTAVAALGQLGRTSEARPLISEMAALRPREPERHWQIINPYAHQVHEDRLVEGLLKAGARDRELRPTG